MQVENTFPNVSCRHPKVSVCVVTYNQEKYIRECLQSIVDQETEFNFEIIVGDDFSSDGTREIIEEFERNYPVLISAIFNNENVGPSENYRLVHEAAFGDFIAHVDGDDFMMPGKLAEQYRLLSKHVDCVLCSHDMYVVDENKNLIEKSYKNRKSGIKNLKDLYSDLPFFAHSSKMVRADIDKAVLGHINNETIDIEIHVKTFQLGNSFHIDKPLGAYRTNVGMSRVDGRVNELLPNAAQRIFESAESAGLFGKKFIKNCYARTMLNYAYQSAVFGNKSDFKLYAKKSISIKLISVYQILIYIFSFWPAAGIFLANFRKNSKDKFSASMVASYLDIL